MEPMSPALQSRFLTTGPPRRFLALSLIETTWWKDEQKILVCVIFFFWQKELAPNISLWPKIPSDRDHLGQCGAVTLEGYRVGLGGLLFSPFFVVTLVLVVSAAGGGLCWERNRENNSQWSSGQGRAFSKMEVLKGVNCCSEYAVQPT